MRRIGLADAWPSRQPGAFIPFHCKERPMIRLLLCAVLALMPATLAAETRYLTHRFGETVVDPAQIKRIVSVGYHEQDFLYALGLAPVGVHDWFGDYPFATWPWAEAARIDSPAAG